MSKYNQLDETKYKNNEYANMPSLDYRASAYDIYRENFDNGCDWDKVREICNKYGFKLEFIFPTFCKNSDITVVIYYKTDVNEDEYIRLLKSNDIDDNRKAWEIIESFNKKYFDLHDCIHELDEETNLYFRCGWGGNCGLFGSEDVRRNVYSFASGLTTYKDLCRSLSPIIHDTAKRFDSGVYIMNRTACFKIDESEMFPEFTNEMAIEVMKSHKPDLNFEVCMGRRACDGPSEYEAIVVTDKKGRQYGSFTFGRDYHDIIGMCYRSILCGETNTTISRDTYVKQIKRALDFIAG